MHDRGKQSGILEKVWGSPLSSYGNFDGCINPLGLIIMLSMSHKAFMKIECNYNIKGSYLHLTYMSWSVSRILLMKNNETQGG